MKYKAILVGEKVEPGKYPIIKQIFGDTLQECEDWAKDILKDKQAPICVAIFRMDWSVIKTVRTIEPDKTPPACEVKSSEQ